MRQVLFEAFKNLKKAIHSKPQATVRLAPTSQSRGTVVISYILWPFLEGIDSPKTRGHTNAWEAVTMANIFLELGFHVEIIDWQNRVYLPPADCRIVMDIDSNIERWNPMLPKGCLKVFHATGPHWIQSNIAELSRIEGIRQRKGLSLMPRRQVQYNRGAELADCITVLGNDYTVSTYLPANVPITRIPISSAYEYPLPETRNFESTRKNFFWLSSYGMAWKGLDLALEAFAQMPELNLTVCGRPEKEPDFFELYRKELLHTPNIRLIGWMDLSSPEFREIAGTHASVVQLGSAEGGGGSAIHCMHAGMIPVCTRENSIDLMDFGYLVDPPTIENVKRLCRQISQTSPSDLKSRSNASYAHVSRVHTRKSFAHNFRVFAESISKRIDS
jgi:glycosyltransferase involved in cell wall biosynthesis